jgi:hypothetical protein
MMSRQKGTDRMEGLLLLLSILVGLTLGVIAGFGLYLVRSATNVLSMEPVDNLSMSLLLVAAFSFGVLTTWMLL